MQLSKKESAAVCQAFCRIQDFIDATSESFENPYGCINGAGTLFLCVEGYSGAFLRDVKDRTMKEIDDFVHDTVDELTARREANREAKIKALRAQLDALEKERTASSTNVELNSEA